MRNEREFNDNLQTREIEFNVFHFVSLFSDFHKAFPDENQHIFRHVIEQIFEKGTKVEQEYIKGEKGQEPVWKITRNDKTIYKRIFHPGSGERITGADFALFKRKALGSMGVTAVQVKRNHGREVFEFEERDLKQLQRFLGLCRSAYYLMVDETVSPPLDCFIMASELRNIILTSGNTPPIRVPNSEVRKYCRGLSMFYDSFYRCFRGSTYEISGYLELVQEYVSMTNRVVVELYIT